MTVRLAIRDLFRMARLRTGLFLLSVICLFCAFLSILLLEEKAYAEYLDELRNNPFDRTLYVHGDSEEIRSLWTTVQKFDSPEIEAATISNQTISGMYYATSINPTPYHTPYGRLFSEEEMASGARVVLLGTHYLSKLTISELENIWKIPFEIEQNTYIPIGSYYDLGSIDASEDDGSDLLLPTQIAMPLQTFLENNLSGNRLRIVFSRQLNAKEYRALQQILSSFSNNVTIQYPGYVQQSAFRNMIGTFFEYWAFLLLVLIGTAGVLYDFLKTELSRDRVYFMCGAKKSLLYRMLTLQVTIIAFLTFAFAMLISLLLARALSNRILAIPPLIIYVVTVLIGVLACIGITFLYAKQTLFADRSGL